MKTLNKKIAILGALFFTLLLTTVYPGILTMGRKKFASPKLAPLLQGSSIAEATRSLKYLRRVGGIAFDSVAEPDGVVLQNILYDKNKEDGKRLVLTVNVNGDIKKITADVYDWEFIPIARYSNTYKYACFTIFGNLDSEFHKSIHANFKTKIYNYHPAFENTLLGLRLMQADLMLYDRDALHNIEFDGKVILGKGEVKANLKQNEKNFNELLKWRLNKSFRYHSYLICNKEKITFSIKENRIIFTGMPVWSCWSSDGEKIISNDAENLALSREIKANNGINPSVYRSLRITLRYSSLFRYWKKKNNIQYNIFLKSLPKEILPEVITPGIDKLSLSPLLMFESDHEIIRLLKKNPQNKAALIELQEIARDVVKSDKDFERRLVTLEIYEHSLKEKNKKQVNQKYPHCLNKVRSMKAEDKIEIANKLNPRNKEDIELINEYIAILKKNIKNE